MLKRTSHLFNSHLFKAQFSGKAGSCFLKVRAAFLIHPRKVTQFLLKTSLHCHNKTSVIMALMSLQALRMKLKS